MIRVTDGTTEPIGYALAQEALRLDDETDELSVNVYIQAARQTFEMHTNCIVTSSQTWKAHFEGWKDFKLPIYPIISVVSVQYYDGNDDLQTYDSANYWVQTYYRYTVIELKPTASTPTLSKRTQSIIVNFTAGHTTMDTVPSSAKEAILLLAGHYYENRQAQITMSGIAGMEVPLGYRSLVHILKTWN